MPQITAGEFRNGVTFDYDGALKVYQDTLKQALEDVKDYSAAEVKGMAKIADILE